MPGLALDEPKVLFLPVTPFGADGSFDPVAFTNHLEGVDVDPSAEHLARLQAILDAGSALV